MLSSKQEVPLFDWTPASRVVPFPAVRQKPRILRAARNAARMETSKGRKSLERDIERYALRLARLGITEEAAAREISAFRGALHVAWIALRADEGGHPA